MLFIAFLAAAAGTSLVSTGIKDTCVAVASNVQLLGGLTSWGSEGTTITGAQVSFTGIRDVFDGHSTSLGNCDCEFFYDDSVQNENERYSVGVECGEGSITSEVLKPGGVNIKTLHIEGYTSSKMVLELENAMVAEGIVFDSSSVNELDLRNQGGRRRRSYPSSPTTPPPSPPPATSAPAPPATPAPAPPTPPPSYTIEIIAETVCIISFTDEVDFTLNPAPSNESCLFDCSSASIASCTCGYGLVLHTITDSSTTPATTTVMCRSNATGAITFDNKTYTLCNGSNATVTWNGNHNIKETAESDCNSVDLSYIDVNYHNSPHTETFTNLGAELGTTRYFKCESHCSNGAKFATTCPELTVSPTALPMIIATTTTAPPASVPTPRPTYAQMPQSSRGTGKKSQDGDDLTIGLIAAACGVVISLSAAVIYTRHKQRINTQAENIIVTKVKGLVF